MWIFISQLHKDTKEEDVKQHLESENIQILECIKLNITNKTIAAFKLTVEANKFETVADENVWPKNTIIRPYRNFWRPASIKTKTQN